MWNTTLRSIVEKYSIPAKFCNEKGYDRTVPTWDGTQLHVPFASDWFLSPDGVARLQTPSFTWGGNTEPIGWLYHEIAHYMFAPAFARSFQNFGLGADPGNPTPSEKIPTAWRGQSAEDDECAVCVLHIMLMAIDDVPQEVVQYNMKEYFIEDVRNRDLQLLKTAGFPKERVLTGVSGYLNVRTDC